MAVSLQFYEGCFATQICLYALIKKRGWIFFLNLFQFESTSDCSEKAILGRKKKISNLLVFSSKCVFCSFCSISIPYFLLPFLSSSWWKRRWGVYPGATSVEEGIFLMFVSLPDNLWFVLCGGKGSCKYKFSKYEMWCFNKKSFIETVWGKFSTFMVSVIFPGI